MIETNDHFYQVETNFGFEHKGGRYFIEAMPDLEHKGSITPGRVYITDETGTVILESRPNQDGKFGFPQRVGHMNHNFSNEELMVLGNKINDNFGNKTNHTTHQICDTIK